LKSTKSGKIKYFLKKKNERKGDQKTNSSTLRALGIAQIMSMVIYLLSFLSAEPVLGYMTEPQQIVNEMYGLLISAIRSIFLIFVCAFILVSILFAFYLRLKYFILFGVLGTVSVLIEKISPLFFITSTYDIYISFSTFFTTILFSTIIFLSILLMVATNNKEETQIRKEILELGTKYPDFKLKNISKNCEIDKNTIISVAKKMIKNKEIYADYFKLSTEWETEHIGKKA